jgi:bifunctional non-homologous end joining protein LigD
VRARLQELGLESLCKTTGGKGLHVVAPIRRVHGWGAVKAFCRALAEAMAADAPRRYVATAAKSRRKGRIYVDFLRNARGATAIAPYSPRARPGAPVAAPVGWEELPHLRAADQYDVAGMARRIAGPAGNPWAAIGDIDQALAATAFRRLGLDPDKPE